MSSPSQSRGPSQNLSGRTRARQRRSRGRAGGSRDLTKQGQPDAQKQQRRQQDMTMGHGGDDLAPGPEDGADGEEKILKLRLDVNLEVDIELKAHLHGDVTLTLLG